MVIQSRLTPPDWTDEEGGGEEGARCRVFQISRDGDGLVHNDTWFQEAEEALPVCNGDYIGTPCPMRQSCLLMALVNNDSIGVFGGMTAPQRRWIRRNIPKERWNDDRFLRDTVPPPDYFTNYGDEDPDAEERTFREEQAALKNAEG
jgi:hypothetical protein